MPENAKAAPNGAASRPGAEAHEGDVREIYPRFTAAVKR